MTNPLLWACALGGLSAASLPLGSWVGLRFRFSPAQASLLTAFGAGALLAALSVELVAPTALELSRSVHGKGPFLALIVGCVLGGLTYVGLDRALNRGGGFLRRPSTLLRYYQKQSSERQLEVLETLARIPLFESFPPESVKSLLEVLTPVRLEAGDVIVEQGALVDTAYFIVDGEVEGRVDEQPIAVDAPYDRIVSLAPMLMGIRSPGTCLARTKVLALRAERHGIDRLRSQFPEFDEACRELVADRIEVFSAIAEKKESAVQHWLRDARKRVVASMDLPPPPEFMKLKEEHPGAPLAIWLGMLLDGIPESITIGAGMSAILAVKLQAGGEVSFLDVVPFTLIAGLFLSNFPEALSSSATMLDQGLKVRRIFLMWFSLMVMTAVGAGLGYLIAGSLSEEWMVLLEGTAAGAMLTMIAAAMIPEAVLMGSGNSVGLSTLGGFLAAVLFKLLE